MSERGTGSGAANAKELAGEVAENAKGFGAKVAMRTGKIT